VRADLRRGRRRQAETVTPAIDARDLTKRYGRDRGVEGLGFSVAPGEVFGFLGPNDAGKTTTIRLLLDLIRPTRGSVRVLGIDPRAGARLRQRIGYLPGDLRLYGRHTARELLAYFARLRGLTSLERAAALADRLELELDRPIHALSKGNRQKVGIVQAFMHEPELLVLDEPTSGLDPLVQQTVYDLLAEQRAAGRTAFISSHVLPEVQHVADRVALLRDGRLLLVDTVDALRRRAFTRVEVVFAAPAARNAFAGLPGVTELERRGTTVALGLHGDADPLVKALAQHRVLTLESREADLEDVFLSLYGERDAA
jgi:ABC-2 type transport system ATP-binding protein